LNASRHFADEATENEDTSLLSFSTIKKKKGKKKGGAFYIFSLAIQELPRNSSAEPASVCASVSSYIGERPATAAKAYYYPPTPFLSSSFPPFFNEALTWGSSSSLLARLFCEVSKEATLIQHALPHRFLSHSPVNCICVLFFFLFPAHPHFYFTLFFFKGGELSPGNNWQINY
jgi:hypothetical protein